MKKTISVITFLFVLGFINAQQRVESVSDLIRCQDIDSIVIRYTA